MQVCASFLISKTLHLRLDLAAVGKQRAQLSYDLLWSLQRLMTCDCQSGPGEPARKSITRLMPMMLPSERLSDKAQRNQSLGEAFAALGLTNPGKS